MVNIKVVNKSGNDLPDYATVHSAGMDIRADLKQPVRIVPHERKLVGTGLYIQLPDGYEAQIRPRSGLALKKGITILNSPGTIDADYRGEVGIIIINHSDVPVFIEPGERICQMVIKRYEKAEWIEVEALDSSERGSGGFGHSGKN